MPGQKRHQTNAECKQSYMTTDLVSSVGEGHTKKGKGSCSRLQEGQVI